MKPFAADHFRRSPLWRALDVVFVEQSGDGLTADVDALADGTQSEWLVYIELGEQ
jgi:hypothetical protein